MGVKNLPKSSLQGGSHFKQQRVNVMGFEEIFTAMLENWQSPLVAREKLMQFTGGLISPKYAANLDAQGKGIQGRIRCGRKVAYPAVNVIEFLKSRASVLG